MKKFLIPIFSGPDIKDRYLCNNSVLLLLIYFTNIYRGIYLFLLIANTCAIMSRCSLLPILKSGGNLYAYMLQAR